MSFTAHNRLSTLSWSKIGFLSWSNASLETRVLRNKSQQPDFWSACTLAVYENHTSNFALAACQAHTCTYSLPPIGLLQNVITLFYKAKMVSELFTVLWETPNDWHRCRQTPSWSLYF